MLGGSPGRSKTEHLLDVLQKQEQKSRIVSDHDEGDKEEEIPTLLTSTTFPLVSTDSGSHPHSLTSLAAIYWTSIPMHSRKLSTEPDNHPQWLQLELGHSHPPQQKPSDH